MPQAPLKPIRNGDTMDVWRDKINDAIAHLNHSETRLPPPGARPKEQYAKLFTKRDWRKFPDGFFRLKILPTEHMLGTTVVVSNVLAKQGEKYSSVLYSWKTYVDGTVIVLTQVLYDGKIYLERGM